MITTAEKGENEVRERSKHVVVGLVKSGEVGGIREVPEHVQPCPLEEAWAERIAIRKCNDQIVVVDHVVVKEHSVQHGGILPDTWLYR